MNKISVIGLDLAKNVFQVHGIDTDGEVVVRKQLNRSQVRRFFANLEPCLIGMEPCGGAHYWSRELTGIGHAVRMMAPIFVKLYLKTNKNDRKDAEAICEAVQHPSMRFVQPKTPEQKAVLHLHHGRLSVSGTPSGLFRREVTVTGYQQTGRQLPPWPADPRREICDLSH